MQDKQAMEKLWVSSMQSMNLPMTSSSNISVTDSNGSFFINTIGFIGLSDILQHFESALLSEELRESELLSSHNSFTTAKPQVKKSRANKFPKSKTSEDINKSNRKKKNSKASPKETNNQHRHREKKEIIQDNTILYAIMYIIAYLGCAVVGGNMLKKKQIAKPNSKSHHRLNKPVAISTLDVLSPPSAPSKVVDTTFSNFQEYCRSVIST